MDYSNQMNCYFSKPEDIKEEILLKLSQFEENLKKLEEAKYVSRETLELEFII